MCVPDRYLKIVTLSIFRENWRHGVTGVFWNILNRKKIIFILKRKSGLSLAKVNRGKRRVYFKLFPKYRINIIRNLRRHYNWLVRSGMKTENKQEIRIFEELVGCSQKDFIEYMEGQFKEGMTWDNYGNGGWTIDHIYPVSRFNLLERDDIFTCYHYRNMRPMWDKENFRKGNKYPEDYFEEKSGGRQGIS